MWTNIGRSGFEDETDGGVSSCMVVLCETGQKTLASLRARSVHKAM